MAGDDKPGYVYLMASVSRIIYVGVTSDLDLRVGQHKAGTYPGFTRRYKIHKLVYVEDYPEIGEAIAREKQLKRWSRGKKIVLIEKDNPEWNDLSRSR